MTHFKPKDIIAVVTIICASIMKLSGADGVVTAILMLVVGYYFAHRQDGVDKGV